MLAPGIARASLFCGLFLLVGALGCSRKAPGAQADAGAAASAAPASTASAAASAAAAREAAEQVQDALKSRPLRTLHVPRSYDAARPSPLLLVLHGYGSRGADHARMFELGGLTEAERVIIAAPDGSENQRGARFWNAVPGCCDFEQQGIDDVGYLRALVRDLSARYAIDASRVYAIGHSNGGAMALRLACDASDVFAAVVDVAGPFYDLSRADACKPQHPVGVRIIHGSDDRVVPYDGGPRTVRVHPRAGQVPIASAPQKAAVFADRLACQPARAADPVDLDVGLPGAETEVSVYPGCRGGVQLELWRVRGGGHAPHAADWSSAWKFLAAHRRTQRVE